MRGIYDKLADWCNDNNLSLNANQKLCDIITPHLEQLEKENNTLTKKMGFYEGYIGALQLTIGRADELFKVLDSNLEKLEDIKKSTTKTKRIK
ncbi:hypothetical protein [Pseudoalteromonas marina]|uniref:hypothetical protein n=1 Tax=Pseudoalteromonas marina TaxID=267375 RepID=UPI003C61273F